MQQERKIDRIAREQFGGDVYAAIEYLLFHLGEGEFDPYIDELTKEEARFVLSLVEREAKRKLGGEENFKKAVKLEGLLQALKMTHEEVAAMDFNPFGKRLIMGIGLLIVGILLCPVLLLLGVNVDTAGSAGAIGIGISAASVTDALLGWLRFRKAKKLTQQVDVPAAIAKK